MTKRGKVLRDPGAGPGLLMVEGRQLEFLLEGVWRSEVPPKPGLTVDVDFNQAGNIIAITAVPESQLAKEQAEAAMAAAKAKGGVLVSTLVAKVGMPGLVAGGLLIVAWFFLTAVSVQLPFMGKLQFTFWQVLGYLNANNILEVMGSRRSPSTGIYGFLCVIALAGPFIHQFWKDKRAHLGGLLPIVFMAIVGLMVRSSINSAMGGDVDGPAGDMQRQAQEEIMKAISLGLGTYLSVLVSLYFAGVGTKKFLAAQSSDKLQPHPQKAAA
jgi:hypothetical protein